MGVRFIKLRNMSDMDVLERRVKAFGDPRFCLSVHRVGNSARGLANCVKALDVESCLRICLEGCRGKGCAEACLGALEAALGVVAARAVARQTAAAVALLGIDPVDAAAPAFNAEMEKIERMKCPERGVAARALAAAAVELYRSFKKAGLREQAQDVLLLMAPALAAAYQCAGKEVFKYLDSIKPIIGEGAVKRIIDEMRRGNVFVGGVLIAFKPVKTGK